MSLLCKYISDLTHVLRVKDAKLEDNLIYEEHLVQILDRFQKAQTQINSFGKGSIEESPSRGGHMGGLARHETKIPITF